MTNIENTFDYPLRIWDTDTSIEALCSYQVFTWTQVQKIIFDEVDISEAIDNSDDKFISLRNNSQWDALIPIEDCYEFLSYLKESRVNWFCASNLPLICALLKSTRYHVILVSFLDYLWIKFHSFNGSKDDVPYLVLEFHTPSGKTFYFEDSDEIVSLETFSNNWNPGDYYWIISNGKQSYLMNISQWGYKFLALNPDKWRNSFELNWISFRTMSDEYDWHHIIDMTNRVIYELWFSNIVTDTDSVRSLHRSITWDYWWEELQKVILFFSWASMCMEFDGRNFWEMHNYVDELKIVWGGLVQISNAQLH